MITKFSKYFMLLKYIGIKKQFDTIFGMRMEDDNNNNQSKIKLI